MVQKFHQLKTFYIFRNGFLWFRQPDPENRGDENEDEREDRKEEKEEVNNEDENVGNLLKDIKIMFNNRENREVIVVPYKFRARIMQFFHDGPLGTSKLAKYFV